MTVRSFKGGVLAEGLYKDIKSNIVNAGGKYHRSVYVMMEDGTIANLSFKGAVVREWSDFMEANRSLTDAQWIEVKEAREEKKGSVKYSVPSFKMGPALSKQDSSNADSVASSLKSYLDGYFNKKEEVTSGEVELDF